MNARRCLRAAIVALITALVLMPSISAAQRRDKSSIARFQHIMVVVLENHSYDQIIGNSNAPSINRLARTYALATRYYGVTHPSEPNYIASIAGSYFGIHDDEPYTSHAGGINHTLSAPNVATQLEARGFSWKTYQESLPYPGFTGFTYPSDLNPLYAVKHNPFMFFKRIQSSAAERRKIVPFTQLALDLRSSRLPSFSYIVPNQCDDMHGGPLDCVLSGSDDLIARGDTFVGTLVTSITRSAVWRRGRNAIAIVWDEDDNGGTSGCCDAIPGGGRVAAIVITNHGPRGVRDSTPYNHYSLLLSIEDAFGLGCLQHSCDRTAVKPMARMFG